MNTARVLVVDDNPSSQRMIGDLLTLDAYEIVFVPTGSAALAEATRQAPDVILLDVMMPDMDGFEVCRHLRLDPLLAEVPIILVTSLDDRASRLRGLEAGADDFVSKPVDGVELRTRVRNIVHLNRYRKLLQERTKAQRAQAEVLLSCEATLAAWVRILERNGPVVTGRCDRIMGLALRLGEAMKMSDADLAAVRWSALLQAIGAMAVPLALRSGDASDLPEEEERVRRHEAWIIEALSPVTVLHDALKIVGSLHEHWDGSGRPQGLRGEAIPLEARVLAVALAWETDQSHEPATSAVRLAILKAQSGRRFEPRLVEAIEQIVNGRQEPRAAPASHTPVVSASAEESRPRPAPLHRFSLTSTGARMQFAVAVVLISVIPLLVMTYLCMSGWLGFQVDSERLWPMVLMVLPFMALGHWMLAKYPINIIRLRRYLESLTQGIVPGHVSLVKDENDLESIEMLMRTVIKQTETRMRTIEAQTDALLEAERQRVMIQSLGAACHHLGQPATVLSLYLQMLLHMELPPKAQAMLEDCRTATESLAAILERFQRLTVYRTEPYLPETESAPNSSESCKILTI